jgi:hypothetical protein
MGVVFDEVEGSVEPETRSMTEGAAEAPKPEEIEMQVRQLLCKLDQRKARLVAN